MCSEIGASAASARGGGVKRQSATSPKIVNAMTSSNAIEIASGRAAAAPSAFELRHQPVTIGGGKRDQDGDGSELACEHLAVARGPQRVDVVELHEREP